jgi:hypothetical protein
MSEGISGKIVFRELEIQNPAIREVFRTFRQLSAQRRLSHNRPVAPAFPSAYAFPSSPATTPAYASPSASPAATPAPEYRSLLRQFSLASILLLSGIVAFAVAVGPVALRFFASHWKMVLGSAGAACVGASVVLLVGRVGASPLRSITPPQVNADDPLQELKDLAERTASRLRTAYRLQLGGVLVVGCLFTALVVWSIVMVSQERILYASAFGSGSVAMLILTSWKWQPFDRINQARRLADNADTLATGLRLRMATISEISDPSERAQMQWNAVAEYIDRS